MSATLPTDVLRVLIAQADLLTLREAAEVIGLPYETVRRRWLRNGSGARGLPEPVFNAGHAGAFWARAQIEEAAPAIRAVGKGRPHKIVVRPVQA